MSQRDVASCIYLFMTTWGDLNLRLRWLSTFLKTCGSTGVALCAVGTETAVPDGCGLHSCDYLTYVHIICVWFLAQTAFLRCDSIGVPSCAVGCNVLNNLPNGRHLIRIYGLTLWLIQLAELLRSSFVKTCGMSVPSCALCYCNCLTSQTDVFSCFLTHEWFLIQAVSIAFWRHMTA